MANKLEKLNGANFLFVPVLSMRDYSTNKYKLNCDGNMARVLSIIYKGEINGIRINHAVINIPSLDKLMQSDFKELKNKIIQKGIDDKITFIFNNNYGINAHDTRMTPKLIDDINNINSFDYIVTEPQYLTKQLINDDSINNNKLIYWCVASETINYSPWFTKEFKEDDKWIASKITTICATDSQVKYLKGKSKLGEFYNANFSDMKIIFFPFRISDESYQWNKFFNMLKRLKSEGVRNYKVLVTDPNNSLENISDDFISIIDSSFPLYISILKGKPIIPYFENADEVLHISIKEMEMYKCEIICYNNHSIQDDTNIYKVSNDEEFYAKLKELIEK